MPYLLTSNPPGSPTSWVKMETDSVLSGHSDFSNMNGHLPPLAPRRHHPPPAPFNAAGGSNNHGSKYANYINTTVASGSASASVSGVNGGSFSTNTLPHNLGQRSFVQQATSSAVMSPTTSVLSNYSLSRNNHHLSFSLSPRANSVLSNSPNYNNQLEHSPSYQTSLGQPPPVNERPNAIFHHQSRGNGENSAKFTQATTGASNRVDVQILQQDPDWGDNTTAVTGLSDLAYGGRSHWADEASNRDESSTSEEEDSDIHSWRFRLQRLAGPWTASVVALVAFLSPMTMLVLPRMQVIQFRETQLRCHVECDGFLVSFSVKLLLLLLATWAIFFRKPKATMPRLYLYRSVLSLLLVILTVTFWLFYATRVTGSQSKRVHFVEILQFASSMVDALLFVQYLAVLLIEIRHLTPEFYIKVVRSPDGASRSYSLGPLTVQRAAAWVLEKYYTDFPVYNPYLERLPGASSNKTYVVPSPFKKRGSNMKHYDVDGFHNGDDMDLPLSSPMLRNAQSKSSPSSNNDRFYEESEYERRLRKRRARLITATEDAFAHIKKLNDQRSKTPSSPLDSYETAQSIFPAIARPLQKYLRLTRQQPRHTMEGILQHLATSLKYHMGPKAFLEKYLVASPVLQNDLEHRPIQTWSLISDVLLTRSIRSGSVFQLRQGDVSLLCQVYRMPHFNLREEIIDERSNKFLLRHNSETPV